MLPFWSSSPGTLFACLTNERYFLFELPSNLVIRRIGPRHWLAFIIICWGAIAIGMGFSPNWQILSVTRALLGVFEVCMTMLSC
jgi:MFS family permease